MRLTAAISQDVQFQFRHGLYYAYAVLSLLYIVVLRLLPQALTHKALSLILFSDVCALGFFFIGAVVLLERGQNLTESLFITPLRLWEYLASKLISLLLLSLASVCVIMAGAAIGGDNWIWFVSGVILSALMYTLLGLLLAARARTVNDYFAKALGVFLLINLPLLAYFVWGDTVWLYLVPTRSTLVLLDILGQNNPSISTGLSILSLTFWTVLSAWGVYLRFDNFVRHPA